MEEPRLTVALTFDHDAIASEVDRGDGPAAVSRGEFGPRVGVPRVLALLEREAIPSTWFVPGHTIETFPESVAAVVAAGHELACHGWLHEDLSTLTPDGERALALHVDEVLKLVDGDAPRTQTSLEQVRALMQADPDLVVVPAHDSAVQDALGYFPAWVR